MNINKTIHQHTTYIYAKEINMEVYLLPACLETYNTFSLISEKNSLSRLELLNLQHSESTQGFY